MKKILLIVITLLFTAGGYAYFLYNKPHENIADGTPYLTATATEIITKFDTDKKSISTEIINKIIQVSGVVSTVEIGKESTIIILNEGIKCEIQSTPNNKIAKRDTLIIKGVYSGFDEMFNEISLVRCFIQ